VTPRTKAQKLQKQLQITWHIVCSLLLVDRENWVLMETYGHSHPKTCTNINIPKLAFQTGHGPAPQWPLGSAPNLHDLVQAQHSATLPSYWKWLEARAWEPWRQVTVTDYCRESDLQKGDISWPNMKK